MSTKQDYERQLKKRWRTVLSDGQRQAWNVFAQFCPGYDNLSLDNDRTGEEMYIICNTPKDL